MCRHVVDNSIPFPTLSIRCHGPELVLLRVAANARRSFASGKAGGLEPGYRFIELRLVENFHAEVIKTLRSLRILEQHEFQRGPIDGEVRVARSPLVGLDPEETAVIGHGLIQISDVEREL